jgi:hypothetical protein
LVGTHPLYDDEGLSAPTGVTERQGKPQAQAGVAGVRRVQRSQVGDHPSVAEQQLGVDETQLRLHAQRLKGCRLCATPGCRCHAVERRTPPLGEGGGEARRGGSRCRQRQRRDTGTGLSKPRRVDVVRRDGEQIFAPVRTQQPLAIGQNAVQRGDAAPRRGGTVCHIVVPQRSDDLTVGHH